jgi:hypothetical protein
MLIMGSLIGLGWILHVQHYFIGGETGYHNLQTVTKEAVQAAIVA